jgi:outer membrane protein TolC
VTSYLEVLIQQTTAFDAELSASQARRARLQSIVSLYTTHGGGWGAAEHDIPVPAPPPPSSPPR